MRIPRWDYVLSSEKTNECIKELALWCTSQIKNATIREDITAFVSGDDFHSLCNFAVDYSAVSASDAYFLRQTLALYQKRQDLELGIDKKAVAWSTFKDSERLCFETNRIFRNWSQGSFQFEPCVEAVLHSAQRKIASVLGDVPSLEAIKARFGPGATTQLTKRKASARRKLGQALCASEDLAPLLPELLAEMPLWIDQYYNGESEVALVPVDLHPGRLGFVPKNAKTFRGICVEPGLNTMWQIGIGEFIARKLKAVGIDITDQTRNQNLAKEGSVSGALATLDLSSASDTIARELVAHLLPIDWFLFLDQFRTGTVVFEEESVKLQKFSSMGNGFTFPLETLIFWGLAAACCDKRDQDKVSVFGDDIIVPTYAYPLLARTLRAAGFLLNSEKSFASGPFRESCGKDYYSGILIRPVYLKDRLSGESAFTMHNYMVRAGFPDAARIILSWLDPCIQIWGPDGYGDGHLIGDWDATPHRRTLSDNPRVSSGWSGYTFETFTWKGLKDFKPYPNDFVYPSYCAYVGGDLSPLGDPALPVLAKRADLVRRYWEQSQVASIFKGLHSLGGCNTTPHQKGLIGSSLPGKKGYKRIKIYTLDPS